MFSWRGEEKLEFWKKMRKAVESGRFGFIYILFDVSSSLYIFRSLLCISVFPVIFYPLFL